jgi:catechol 2,3-dioxygenase-like lactoylglutathione lyase family enzyme
MESKFLSATPVLASLDIQRSVAFYCKHLGFEVRHSDQGVYGIVGRDSVFIHFWACSERHIAEHTSCRLRVSGVEALYAQCLADGIVHSKAHLDTKPWNTREFAILDPDGNLVTFAEWADA